MRELVLKNIKAILAALSAFVIQAIDALPEASTVNTPEEFGVMALYSLVAGALTWAIPNQPE